MKTVTVSTSSLRDGFEIHINKQAYPVKYPQKIWNAFPKNIHQLFSETVAYYFTYHLFFKNRKQLIYTFYPSLAQSFFINGLLMTLPEAVLEIPKAKFLAEILFKMLYQSQHDTTYIPNQVSYKPYTCNPYKPFSGKVMIPLSLGKDSLLTFGITRELGLKQTLVFFVEPHSTNEVSNKMKLGQEFMKKFNVTITYVPVTLGTLREVGGTQWGWDLILTQYSLLALPYLYYEKIEYLLWSQEQNYNIKTATNFGLTITMNYDETSKWRMQLNSLLSYFGVSAVIGSFNEPLMEFADTYILHHRYPDIAAFQLSCDNDHQNAKTNRWCHACAECARFYVYLLAMGINPERVGLKENMLTSKKLNLYNIFFDKDMRVHDHIYQFSDDFLFALYLVYKRGIKGAVIERFKKQYLRKVELKLKTGLFEKMTRLHSTSTVPAFYKAKALAIYHQELKNLCDEMTEFL